MRQTAKMVTIPLYRYRKGRIYFTKKIRQKSILKDIYHLEYIIYHSYVMYEMCEIL